MSYTKFENTDIYINQNHGCTKGFDVNISFHSIQELAEIFDCNIIVKTKSKWYLKKGLYQPSLNFILFNQRKGLYKNSTTYIKEYEPIEFKE
jgi:hypothetical protein